MSLTCSLLSHLGGAVSKRDDLDCLMEKNFILTPKRHGTAKYLRSPPTPPFIIELSTYAHSTLPSPSLRASNKLSQNLAAAYAIDKVAEPCFEKKKITVVAKSKPSR